jgi:cytochrome b6-f complex iron-sulfur subunit
MAPKQSRREFCVQACQAASIVTLGSFVQGCGGGGGNPGSPSGGGSDAPQLPIISGTVANRVVSVTIDPAGSPLANVGSAALVNTSSGNFLVSRSGQTFFIALTATCTHEQCNITGFENSNYVCPCHGSTYSTSGSVLMGPATRSLQQYPTQFTNNVLTFTI